MSEVEEFLVIMTDLRDHLIPLLARRDDNVDGEFLRRVQLFTREVAELLANPDMLDVELVMKLWAEIKWIGEAA